MKSVAGQTPLSLSDIIFISNKNRYERILKKDIYYIEAQGSYVDIYMAEGKRNFSTHLKSFLHQLDDPNFIQVSRKHAVNVLYISEFMTDYVVVGTLNIPVTSSFKVELTRKLPIIKTKI